MLKLNSDSWIIRTFRFSEHMKGKFHNWHWLRTDRIETSPTTNLCYMVRSIVVYLPFMVVMHLAALLMVLEASFIYPMSKAGWRWLLVPGWIIGLVAAVIVIIIMTGILSYGGSYFSEWCKRNIKTKTYTVQKSSDTRNVIREYLKARHEMICPVISIVGDELPKPCSNVYGIPMPEGAAVPPTYTNDPSYVTDPDDPENQA